MSSPRPVVYWRPHCGFCARLFRGLAAAGIDHDQRDIWEDPEAAAFVRSVAGGHETVPTVTVGDRVLVNPAVEDVEGVLADGGA